MDTAPGGNIDRPPRPRRTVRVSVESAADHSGESSRPRARASAGLARHGRGVLTRWPWVAALRHALETAPSPRWPPPWRSSMPMRCGTGSSVPARWGKKDHHRERVRHRTGTGLAVLPRTPGGGLLSPTSPRPCGRAPGIRPQGGDGEPRTWRADPAASGRDPEVSECLA
jgi:hypothetical protein